VVGLIKLVCLSLGVLIILLTITSSDIRMSGRSKGRSIRIKKCKINTPKKPIVNFESRKDYQKKEVVDEH